MSSMQEKKENVSKWKNVLIVLAVLIYIVGTICFMREVLQLPFSGWLTKTLAFAFGWLAYTFTFFVVVLCLCLWGIVKKANVSFWLTELVLVAFGAAAQFVFWGIAAGQLQLLIAMVIAIVISFAGMMLSEKFPPYE